MGNPFTEALQVVQKDERRPANPFLDALTPDVEGEAAARFQQESERLQAQALTGVEEVPGLLSRAGSGIAAGLRAIDPRKLLPSNLAAAARAVPPEDIPPLPQGTGLEQALGVEGAREPLAFRAFQALPQSVQDVATRLSESLEEVPVTVPISPITASRFGLPSTLEANIPVTSAVAGLAELPIELTSPQNLAILGTLGLGIGALRTLGPVVGPLLQTAATGGLGTAAAVDALKKSPDFIQAVQEGRGEDAARIGGNIVTEAVAAGLLLRSARGSLGTAGEAARSARLAREADVFAETRGLPDPAEVSVAARQPFDIEIDPLTGEPVGAVPTPQLASPLRRALQAPPAEGPPIPLPGVGGVVTPPAPVPAGLGTRIQPPGGPFQLPTVTPIPLAEAAAIQGQPLEGGPPVSARPAPITPLTPQQQAGALRRFRTGIRGPEVPPDITAEGEALFREAAAPSAAQLRTGLGGQLEAATPPAVSDAQASAPPFDFDERLEAFAGPEPAETSLQLTSPGRILGNQFRIGDTFIDAGGEPRFVQEIEEDGTVRARDGDIIDIEPDEVVSY